MARASKFKRSRTSGDMQRSDNPLPSEPASQGTTMADQNDTDTKGPAEGDLDTGAAFVAHLDSVFEAWIRECIHNSPLSRETVSYNHLLEVLPDLKSRILGGE